MYKPPIEDYEFLLRDVFDGQHTLDLTRGDDLTLDDAIDLLGYAGTLAAEVIAPEGVVPTPSRAGADQPGVSTGQGLAAVSALGYRGFRAGPPLIGGVAQLTSLRLACGLRALAGLIVMVLAANAGPRPQGYPPITQPSFTT